tara:strand:- start:252 stop:485 length:234 start_codon:yes stop_codon:yes gene_type:complete
METTHEEKRRYRINRIRRTLAKAKVEKPLTGEIDEEEFLVEIMKRWNIGRSLAKDYLLCAGYIDPDSQIQRKLKTGE